MARRHLTLEISWTWNIPEYGNHSSHDNYVISLDETKVPDQLNYSIVLYAKDLNQESIDFILKVMSPEMWDTYLNHRENTRINFHRTLYTELP